LAPRAGGSSERTAVEVPRFRHLLRVSDGSRTRDRLDHPERAARHGV
jgi:hypothetical protein